MSRCIVLCALLLALIPAHADVQDVHDNGLVARYYTAAGHTAVLVVGGSDGGYASPDVGAALERAGYPALTLAYFQNRKGEPADVPDALSRIRLEYMFQAIDWLKAQPGIERIVLMGHSRGTELVMETAIRRTDIAGVVVFAPSSLRFGSTSGWRAAWTLDGKSLPYLGGVYNTPEDFKEVLEGTSRKKAEIAVEKIRAPLLLVSSTADAIWPSARMADEIAARATCPVTNLKFDNASHNLMGPGPGTVKLKVGSSVIDFGGTEEGTRHARDEGWAATLKFLTALKAC
jgi:dienelactone hydrolase